MLRKKQITMVSAESELKRKIKIAALGVSLSAIGFCYVLLNSGHAPPAPPTSRTVEAAPLDRDEVLVAAHDIPMGMRIGDASVDWQAWPKASISDQMIVKSSSPDVLRNINGFMSRVAFVHGEPMRLDKLVKGGEGGFMSADSACRHARRRDQDRQRRRLGRPAGSFCPTIASMWSASIAMTWRRSRTAR